MKKCLSVTLALFLLFSTLALALAGCGATAATITTAATTAAAATTAGAAKKTVRLSTTTSVNDSGLLPELEKMFEAKTGYPLDIVANGTGAAIKLGETGDADVLLVHAKASEDAFVTAGFGVKRIPFMHNYFIIAGPESDPAKIKSAKTAAEAFKLIAAAKAPFISRGDDSGTNKAELVIWTTAGIKPEGSWYNSAGKGMGPCLQMAGELSAYILTDKATYLATKAQTKLAIVLNESEDMKNTYSLIAVNPEKQKAVNAAGAQAFIDFMLSPEAKAFIAAYGKDKYGEALFLYDGAQN